ncbi:hypothetical protein CH35J_009644 [Colletotrichum higginsianum]|nr:hypothetical protein CH35J_009644 [Colletotrichum higginsianum]
MSTIPLNISAQNAGVLITKVHNSVRLEAFELSSTNEAAMATSGRLRRTFPGVGVTVDLEKFNQLGFKETLAETLATMSFQRAAGTQPCAKKAGKLHEESRDTTHPKMVTELLYAFLLAVGHPLDEARISKNTRDEVNWNNTLLPWRRSPTWLLVRVSLQLIFGRLADPDNSLYKSFMAFFMAEILHNSLESTVQSNLQSDLLLCMVAKLSRRLLKLTSEPVPAALDHVRETMRQANKLLSDRWLNIQKQDSPGLGKELGALEASDFEKDSIMHLPELDDFLASFARRGTQTAASHFSPSWTVSLYDSSLLPSEVVVPDNAHLSLHLTAFEAWVGKNLQTWFAGHKTTANTCSQLRSLIEDYHGKASTFYGDKSNPELISIMLLTILELWIVCDKATIQIHPLLRNFDPEIPLGLFQNLLLTTRAHLERLHNAESYVRERLEKCESRSSAPNIYTTYGSSGCFSVRYFDQSVKHQSLRSEIEEQARKDRERKKNKLRRLKDKYDDLMRKYHASSCEYYQGYNKITGVPFKAHSRYCSRCSYFEQANSLQIEIHEWPLPNGLLALKSTVFELSVPEGFGSWREASIYFLFNVLKEYIFRPSSMPSGPPPNTILANLHECPDDMTIEEFKAIASIPLGYNIQLRNIMIQLFSPSVDFNRRETVLVIQQCIYQAGPPNKSASRCAHDICEDEKFASRMMEGLFEATQRFEENWQSSAALTAFTALARCLLSLTPSSDIQRECIRFLSKARDVTFSWAQGLKIKAQESSVDVDKLEFQRRALESYLICADTFNIDERFQDAVFSGNASVSTFLQCSINIQEGAQALLASLDAPMVVHFCLLTGEFLVDGVPLNRLPKDYLDHESYKSLFGSLSAEIMPTPVPGMRFSLKRRYAGYLVHLGLTHGPGRTVPDFLVQASRGNFNYELVPKRCLRGSLPTKFVEDYVHWWDYTGECVEFRDNKAPWLLATSHWRLTRVHYDSKWQLVRDDSTLVDVRSQSAQLISTIFRPLEDPYWIHIVRRKSDSSVAVELPRARLEFGYAPRQPPSILSRQYRGMSVDPDQFIGTLVGLKDKLVLRDDQPRHPAIPARRKVLVLEGRVSFAKTKDHVEVCISKGDAARVHAYEVDDRLARLVSNESRQSNLFLSYLHALTSFAIPDPLTERTGTEQALSILSSASVKSFDVLTGENINILSKLAQLTPGRRFYPASERVMQTITWDSQLGFLAQQGLFLGHVQSIFKQAERSKFFHPECYVSPPDPEPNRVDSYLLKRDILRSSTFRVSGFGAESFSLHHDAPYAARDRAGSSASSQAFKIGQLVFSEEPVLIESLPTGMESLLWNFLSNSTSVSGSDCDLPTAQVTYDADLLSKNSSLDFITSNWIGLQKSLRTSVNKHHLMMWLATLAFAQNTDTAVLQTLASSQTSQHVAGVSAPGGVLFDLRDGCTFDATRIRARLEDSCVPFDESPEPRLHQRVHESDYAFMQRQEKDYQANLRRAVDALLDILRSQWPCKVPKIPPNHSEKCHWDMYVRVKEALPGIQALFKTWYDNLQFKDYLGEIVRSMPSQIKPRTLKKSLMATPCPALSSRPRFVSEDALFKSCQPPSIVTEPRIFDLEDYPDTLLLEVESSITVREVQENIAEKMRSPPGNENAVMQLNMGEGKSSVIVPMVAAALADGSCLVRVIVAKPQSKQMLQMMVSKLGGLLDRRIFHIPFSRAVRVDISETTAIQAIFQDCMDCRGILLVQPEHILSFQLMAIETAILRKASVSQSLVRAKDFLGRVSRDIVDESDENFSVKFELVYTMGTQRPVEFSPDRWVCIQQVLEVVRKFLPEVQKAHADSIEVSAQHDGCFPRTRILQESARDLLLGLVARHLSKAGSKGLPMAIQSSHVQNAVFTYIYKTDLSKSEIDAVETSELWSSSTKDAILLLRGLISSQILGFVFCQKRWRVDYGLDHNRRPSTRLAVPYRAKDNPSARSEFSHPDVIVILTSLSYYYGGLDDSELFMSFEHLTRSDQADMEYGYWVKDSHNLPVAFQQLTGINLEDRQQCVEQVFPCIRFSKGTIDYFLQHIVFPKEMKEFPHKLSASGWDIGAKKVNATTGFSGTNDSRAFLPLSVKQLDLPEQKPTNALVLEYLLQNENSVALMPAVKGSDKSVAETLLEMVVRLDPPARVILDVGAQILELDNLGVAKRWLQMMDNHEMTQAVIFCDEDDHICVVDRRGRVESFQTSPFANQTDVCLVFLDEAHTRGTDLKLPGGYRAAVTLGANLTKDRLLGKGQSVVFCVPDEIRQKITARSQNSGDTAITVAHILEWSISETFADLQRGIWLWANQGRRYQRHEILWDEARVDAEETELSQTQAEEFLEEEAQTIEVRYRPGHQLDTSQISLDNEHCADAITQRLRQFGGLKLESTTFREEQERELSPEVEQEREVQKPPHATPAEHAIHPDVRAFISKGTVVKDSPAFLFAFQALSDTSAAQYYDVAKFPPSLLVTTDFTRTIIPVGKGHTSDLFQRPVQWILTTASSAGVVEQAVVISPYEAQELLPEIRVSRHVSLHLYAPRPNIGYRPLDTLRLHTTPHQPIPRVMPEVFTNELNLFSGQLYMKSMNEYLSVRRFLGLRSADQKDSEPELSGSSTNVMDTETPNLIKFLRVLTMKIRRNCESIDKTHLGRILDHRTLDDSDFANGMDMDM